MGNRIAYAYTELKTLNRIDLSIFGYYFDAICQDKQLQEFCINQGYVDIVIAWKDMNKLSYNKKKK